MQVELDAFSGRPNPRWQLTSAQAEEFLARLRGLPPMADIQLGDAGLGYRGFVVTADGGPVNDYDEVRLYRGTVVARRGNRRQTFADPNRSLERWLLDSARGNVDDSVLRYIRDEIGS